METAGRERQREIERDGEGELEDKKDNVMSMFEMMRIFMTSIYSMLHKV